MYTPKKNHTRDLSKIYDKYVYLHHQNHMKGIKKRKIVSKKCILALNFPK